MMRNVFGAAVLLVAFGLGTAQAAPPPPPAVNWTGFYIGGNVGYSLGRSDTTETLTGGGKAFSQSHGIDLNGGAGGVQLGYNWQFDSQWLVGIEADLQGTTEGGNTSSFCPTPTCSATAITFTTGSIRTSLSQTLDWFGTVRGRVGFLVVPNWLFYATGGYAYGRVSWNAQVSGTEGTGGAPRFSAFSGHDSLDGWAAGGGVEGMMGRNWIIRVEYLHIDLGSFSEGPLATTINMGVFPSTAKFGFNSDVTDDIIRIGLSYIFR